MALLLLLLLLLLLAGGSQARNVVNKLPPANSLRDLVNDPSKMSKAMQVLQAAGLIPSPPALIRTTTQAYEVTFYGKYMVFFDPGETMPFTHLH
jgi:hypothetical protein